MKDKKYKLGEKKVFENITLYRVIALRTFSNVNAGDIGGWVEGEHNLSQVCDSAWVYDDSVIYGSSIWNNNKILENMEYEVIANFLEKHYDIKIEVIR